MEIENSLPEFDLEFDEIIVDETTVPVVEDNKDTPIIEGDPIVEIEEEKVYPETADPAAIAAYDRYLEQGLIDEDPNFDGTWEKLEENLDSLPQRVLNSLVGKASDTTKDVVRFLFSADNITIDEVLNFVKTNAGEITETSESIETMDDARSYLEKVYQERGMKPRAIEVTIAAFEEDETLLDEAKEELEKLNASKKDRPKTEALIAAKENEVLQANEERTKFAGQIFQELQNTGWKQTKIDEVKARISKNDINPILTEIFKSPKAFIKMADFIGYFKNGDIDYDAFINTVETPKAKDLKSRLENIVNSPTLSTKSNLKNPTVNTDNLTPVFDY